MMISEEQIIPCSCCRPFQACELLFSIPSLSFHVLATHHSRIMPALSIMPTVLTDHSMLVILIILNHATDHSIHDGSYNSASEVENMFILFFA